MKTTKRGVSYHERYRVITPKLVLWVGDDYDSRTRSEELFNSWPTVQAAPLMRAIAVTQEVDYETIACKQIWGDMVVDFTCAREISAALIRSHRRRLPRKGRKIHLSDEHEPLRGVVVDAMDARNVSVGMFDEFSDRLTSEARYKLIRVHLDTQKHVPPEHRFRWRSDHGTYPVEMLSHHLEPVK